MSSLINNLNRFIRLFENAVCSVGLILTTFLVFFQVINRYWLHMEIMWLNDLALYLFVFSMFLTISLTTREEGHTSVDVFAEMFFGKNPRMHSIYKTILNLISLIILFVFASPVWRFTLRALNYPEYGTLVRWFNTSWLAESMFVMLILCIFHMIFILFSRSKGMKKIVSTNEEGQEE